MRIGPGSDLGMKYVVSGWQDYIRGGGTQASMDYPVRLIDAGALSASTTYFYSIPCFGAATVQATLFPSIVTGTVTVTMYKTLTDNFTEKQTDAGASEAVTITLVQGAYRGGTISNLRGERLVVLKIVVAAASTATFTTAEYSAL